MSYHLGVDLGTTFTCAAIHEASRVEVVSLGERGPSIPSVLYLRPEGDLLAGDAAERHAVTEPERIAREFKRRLGDPTPMLLGGAAARPEVLTGNLLRWVYETVVRSAGGPPATLALTHPANWGSYKLDLFATSAEVAGLPEVTFVTEPQAAAIAYASEARVDPGSVVAVYDLGGGTFDAAVLRKEQDGGFTMLGTPEGIERLGGIDFDAAVFAHVGQSLDGVIDELDPDDDAAIAAVSRLRRECTQAKEALSSDTEATIPVLLPNKQADVRITRDQFEEMIRPTLAETTTALERALRSADLQPGDVDHVLLVGGSSRVPLVGQLVSSALGRPVSIDAHPKHAIALGAAHIAARAGGVATVDAHTSSTQAVGGGEALPPTPSGVAAPPTSDPLAGQRPSPPTLPPAGNSVFGAVAAQAQAAASAPTAPVFDPTPAPGTPGVPGYGPSPGHTAPTGGYGTAPGPGGYAPASAGGYGGPASPPGGSVHVPQGSPPPRDSSSRPAPPSSPPGGGVRGADGRPLPPPPGGPPTARVDTAGGYPTAPGYGSGGYPAAGGGQPGYGGQPGGYGAPGGQSYGGQQPGYGGAQGVGSGSYQPPYGYGAPGQSQDLPPGLRGADQRASQHQGATRQNRNRTLMIVFTILFVLACAGVVLYVTVLGKDDDDAAPLGGGAPVAVAGAAPATAPAPPPS